MIQRECLCRAEGYLFPKGGYGIGAPITAGGVVSRQKQDSRLLERCERKDRVLTKQWHQIGFYVLMRQPVTNNYAETNISKANLCWVSYLNPTYLAEPRKHSCFIAEVVRQKIEQKEKEELEKLLVEGHRVAAKESHALTRGLENADLEGWNDS